MNKNIYEFSSYKQIIEKFDSICFNDKYKLINYLFITGNNSEVLELLKKMYQTKLSKKEKNKVDYLQLIYHINNKDNFNRDTIKYKLIKNNSNEEWFYNIVCEENIEKKLKILQNLIKNKKLKKLLKKDARYRKNIIYVYLTNFSCLDEPFRIDYIEKYIVNSIRKLNAKKLLAIDDISYVEQISNIIFGTLSFIYIKNNDFFIDFVEYKKLVQKTIRDRSRYKDFSKLSNIEFNTIMYYAIRDMANMDEFSLEEKINMSKYLDEFFNKNATEIADHIKITKKVYSGNFWNEIENIIKEDNKEINILDLVMNNVCFDNRNLQSTYDKLEDFINKYIDKTSEQIINELTLCREIVRLWNYGIFNRESLKGTKFIISDFSELIIKFFNSEIKSEDFIFELNNINKIDCFEIVNWKLLEKKCKVFNDYEWLAMILEKINTGFDKKANDYFQEIYNDILKRKRNMYLKDFIRLNNILVKRFDNNFAFLVNSTNILIQLYKDYNDAETLIEQNINNWDKIKIQDKSTYFIYILIVLVEQNLNKIPLYKIKNIVDNIDIPICKSFIYLYLSIIYIEIKISEKDYKEILKYIIDCYNRIDNIEDDVYRIIASFAMIYEKNRNVIELPKYDIIYYGEEKHYHKKTNEQLLKEGFNLLSIEELDNNKIIQNMKKTHLLIFFVCRIFFMKIEEKGLGKSISIPVNADAKKIITELNKALGMEKVISAKKEIRDGKKIDAPWLNIYDYNSLFEDEISAKWKLFKNVCNNRFLSQSKIIHLSTAILLAKINRLDILEKNDCYVSFSVYDETIKRNRKEVVELGRGVIEEAIFYDKELNELANVLESLNKNEHIFTVTQARILPHEGINKYDDEIVKIVVEKINDYGNFCIITEDPFWLVTEPFSNLSESIISLLIDSLKNDIITTAEFLDSIKKLDEIGYNMDIGNVLYNYLLTKSDDNNIKQVIGIINKYKLK